MSGGSGIAPAPALSRAIGGSPDGRIMPGFRIPRGSKARLHPPEETDDLGAVDPLEKSRPAAGRRRARRTARRPAPTTVSVISSNSPATSASQPGPLHLGKQVHVHVAVAGVTEDHDGESAGRRGASHGGHVVAEPRQGNAAVLDHLEGTAVRRASSPGSGWRRAGGARAGRRLRGTHAASTSNESGRATATAASAKRAELLRAGRLELHQKNRLDAAPVGDG